jgi:hypothetical protein
MWTSLIFYAGMSFGVLLGVILGLFFVLVTRRD